MLPGGSMDEIGKLKNKMYQFGDTLEQQGRILERQGDVLNSVADILDGIKGAIQKVADVSQNQARHEERITSLTDKCSSTHKRVDLDIEKIFDLIGNTRCKSHTSEIAALDRRITENSTEDKARNARAFTGWQTLAVTVLGLIVGAVITFILK